MHIQAIEDESGNLVDVLYYCSHTCADLDGAPYPSWWPTEVETDYCIYCNVCEDVLQHGITECDHEE